MKLNDPYIVRISDEDENGNGIARINNFVVFVSHALKDEELLIKITNINKRFANAKIIKIILASKKRCAVKCGSYEKCGACSFLHTDIDTEKKLKLKKINELFNLNVENILTNNEYYYRNKATFHVKNNTIGYYSEKTNEIIEFSNCLILDYRINAIYNYFKSSNLNKINEIIVRVTNEEIMIIIKGNLNIYDYKNLINKFNINSIYLNNKLIYGNAYIIQKINNIIYTIYPNAFFQVNYDNMKLLYDKVKEYAGNGNKLVDLYCGTGTISIYLSENFNEIIGIEINKEAILNANINKKLNKIKNVNFICGDASILKKDKYDVIVIDPPRSGLNNKVIKLLNELKINKIVYVSCNLKTLKKDIELLNKYKLIKMECINMFNKTKHVESVCILERTK